MYFYSQNAERETARLETINSKTKASYLALKNNKDAGELHTASSYRSASGSLAGTHTLA